MINSRYQNNIWGLQVEEQEFKCSLDWLSESIWQRST
jgi:hypothetical protein